MKLTEKVVKNLIGILFIIITVGCGTKQAATEQDNTARAQQATLITEDDEALLDEDTVDVEEGW